jgi:hypothetical protein
VCTSGNSFSGERVIGPLICRDCGFVLSEKPVVFDSNLKACIFCDNDRWFYYDSPLSLRFLGRDSVCYVCEGHYRDVSIDKPEDRFSSTSHDDAQRSTFVQYWRSRVKAYLNNAAGKD